MLDIYEYMVRAEVAKRRSEEATDPAEREAFSEIAVTWRWLIDFVERTEARRPVN